MDAWNGEALWRSIQSATVELKRIADALERAYPTPGQRDQSVGQFVEDRSIFSTPRLEPIARLLDGPIVDEEY